METRNITIVTTQDQNKYVVNTDATTLRELKSALDAQGIVYGGMTFYEGLSHTELLTDDAILPHDVPYKGETTNELVFMLTTPNKKIRSGAGLPEARQALYDTIEEMNLGAACIAVYGKNFTQCKNSELMALIEEAQAQAEAGCGDSRLEAAFRLLIAIMEDDELLYSADADKIKDILDGKTPVDGPQSKYSDEEIDHMFNFLD